MSLLDRIERAGNALPDPTTLFAAGAVLVMLLSQLAVSLEPVYAIVLAIVLLREQRELTPGFYLGVALILAAVFAHTWVKLHAAPR